MIFQSLDVALDLELAVTDIYTGQYFLEEIDGIAAATGISARVSLKKRFFKRIL